MEALQAGAVDFVLKPTALATERLWAVRQELMEKVKAAGRCPVEAASLPAPGRAPPSPGCPQSHVSTSWSWAFPQADPRRCAASPQFPADFPVPIAIVLHMPPGYTAMFAAKLDELSALSVRESAGRRPAAGTALVAQAGRHLFLERTTSGFVEAQLRTEPLDKPHRPSVDILFRSAADTYGSRVLAVVMTGMGEDGREGAAWVKAQGGTVLTEAGRELRYLRHASLRGWNGLSDAFLVRFDGRRDHQISMNAKILVVDDSGLARRMLRQLLEQLGYAVEEAADGVEALERYVLNRHDLVMLDMVMHGMYGLEVLTRFRELNPKLPVVIATADIQKSTREQVRARAPPR